MKLLQSIDQQGYEYILSVNSQRAFKTSLGGFLILILSIITTLAFVAFGRDLITRKGPIVYSANSIYKNSTLSKESFKKYRAAIALMYSGGFRIPDIERMVDLHSIETNTDPSRAVTTTFNLFSMDTCLEKANYTQELKNELQSNFIGLNDTYKCLYDKYENDIYGTFGDPKFVMWGFNVKFCSNSTKNNNHCFPREYIQAKLKEFYAHVIFESYFVDSNDFEEPVKFIYSAKLTRLSALSSRRDTIYLRSFEYISDNGFILEDKSSYKGFDVVLHDKEAIYDFNTELIFRIQFTLDKLKTRIDRVYLKVQKVAADIGGIVKFFSMIFFLISKSYSQMRLYDYFIKYSLSQNIEKFNNNNSFNNNLSNFNRDDSYGKSFHDKIGVSITTNKNYITNNYVTALKKNDQEATNVKMLSTSKNEGITDTNYKNDTNNTNTNNVKYGIYSDNTKLKKLAVEKNCKNLNLHSINDKSSQAIQTVPFQRDLSFDDSKHLLFSNYSFDYLSILKVNLKFCRDNKTKAILTMKENMFKILSIENLLKYEQMLNEVKEHLFGKNSEESKIFEERCVKRITNNLLK